jgi:hypothetical protein
VAAEAQYRFALAEPSWRVSEVHEPPPWVNPAEIEAERKRLPNSAFLRYWGNVWAAGEDALLDPADIAACAMLTGPSDYEPGKAYAIGVDLALRNDRAVLLTGHREGIGPQSTIAVDRLDIFDPRPGRDVDLQNVEERVEARSHQYGGAPCIFDPAQAWQMMARLRSRGVRVVEHTFSASSNNRRTLLLLDLVRSQRFQLLRDDDLLAELTNLRVKELAPGQFRYDHPIGGHDDRVTALSLVALHLIEHAGGPARTSARAFATRRLPALAGPSIGRVETLADRRKREFEAGVWSPLGGGDAA